MSEQWKIIAAFVAVIVASLVFKEYRKKIYGAGIYHVSGWYFNNPIWISVELKWGLEGVVYMIISAAIINTLLLLYYRKKRASWILWDALYAKKEKKEIYREKYQSWKQKKNLPNLIYLVGTYAGAQVFSFLQYCLQIRVIGKPLVFLVLSFQEDPFIATTFIRHGRKEINGITKKDVIIFIISLVISIGYWAMRNGLVTEFIIRPILKI